MRLLLIRHAQSANNALPEEERVEDPAITPLGHEQAERLGGWLAEVGLTRLVTSPFRRAMQTAEYIRRTVGDVPAEIRIDLHEQGGCYAGHEPALYRGRPGMNRQQLAAEFPDYEIDPGIDGDGWWRSQPYESWEQARDRARRLVQRTLDVFAATDETVAYVMHADYKKLVLREFIAPSLTSSNGWPSGIYNTAVTSLVITPDRVHLDQYNSTGHLPFRLWSK